MRLTVLGCNGAYGDPDSGTSAYLISSGQAKILVDCGSGAIAELIKYADPGSLTAVVLTHLHGDHYCDMLVYQYYLQLHDKRMRVIVPDMQGYERELLGSPFFDIQTISGDDVFDGLTLKYFMVDHPIPTYGIQFIEDGIIKLIYSADTRMFDGLAEICCGADVLLLDCAVPDRLHTGEVKHMSISQGRALREQTGAMLIVTHIMPTMPLDEKDKHDVSIAYRGMIVDI